MPEDPATDPTLTLPPSEQVAPNGTVAVSGITYDDSAASANPGSLFLRISDTAGELFASDAAGAIPGSGTGLIEVSLSYADLQAALASLTYVAGATNATDTINFDVWDQFGIETTGTIPVTVGTGSSTTEFWTGAASTDWNQAANWSGGVVPGPGDTAIIPAGIFNEATLTDAILDNETIVLADDSTGNTPDLFLGRVTLGAGTTLETTSPGPFPSPHIQMIGDLTIAAGATIQTTGSTGLAVFNSNLGNNTIINNGLVYNASLQGVGDLFSPTFINKGTIIADTAGFAFGSLVNNGTLLMRQGELDFRTVSGGVITLAGSVEIVPGPMGFTNGAAIAGFGQGDQITGRLGTATTGNTMSFANGTLDLTSRGTLVQAIPLLGSYELGNFQLSTQVFTTQFGPMTNYTIAYAPDGGPSNIGTFSPDVSAPAAAAIVQGGTLGLGSVSIANTGSLTLDISAATGSLFMDGAAGSGTNHLTIATLTAESQVDADLASLRYVPASGATTDTIQITAQTMGFSGPNQTMRDIPISIGDSGPVLTEPTGETVQAGATIAVSGTYSDSFAASNPGRMFLGVSAEGGTLSATDASGNQTAGSGTSSIAIATDFVDVNAILANLHYTAAVSGTSDTIRFDVWNQAGVETTGATSINIGVATMSAADFVPARLESSMVTVAPSTGPFLAADGSQPTIAMPLWRGQ